MPDGGRVAQNGARPGAIVAEEQAAADVLSRAEPVVLELGGGAVGSQATRTALAARGFSVLLDVDADEAWQRVEGSGRPLAADPERFYVPAYVGHKGWVGVRLDGKVDWEEVASLIKLSYRMTAPKRLAAQLD